MKIFKLVTQALASKTYYWGQNSVSHLNPSDSSKWEKRLSYYCDFNWVDNIVLGFINNFPGDSFPGMNHAYHCWTTFQGTNLLNCPDIGLDIKYCQSRGKKIGISLGGAYGTYGFQNNNQANQFAYTLWNLFFEGQSVLRPYGNAVLDFVDFNIESGSSIGYYELSKTLRSLMDNGQKSYFMTTAPQCVYPDKYIGPGNGFLLSTNDTNYIDNVFVQFYNNYCGLNNYPSGFNYNNWNDWSQSKNSSLSIGFPTHQSAAGSGFVSSTTLSTILRDTYLKYSNSFGGIMGWDIGFANIDNYGVDVHSILQNMVGTTPTPTSCFTATVTITPTTTATSTTTLSQSTTLFTTMTSTQTTTLFLTSTTDTVVITTTSTLISTTTTSLITTRFRQSTLTTTLTVTPTCTSV